MIQIDLCTPAGREPVELEGPLLSTYQRWSPRRSLPRLEEPAVRVSSEIETYRLVMMKGGRKDDPMRPRRITQGIIYRWREYHLAEACTCYSASAARCPCIHDMPWRDIPTDNPVRCALCGAPAESFRAPKLSLCYHCKIDYQEMSDG
jgi:hypothetical protein